MAVSLGHNQYGKAEIRMVRVTRDGDRHELKDLNVGFALSGDLTDVHLSGDNANLVLTDTQKSTVYAFAKEAPVGEIEDFGLRLARHFWTTSSRSPRPASTWEEYPWARIEVGGTPHDHALVRGSGERRTATVVARGGRAWVVSGLADLVVLKSTGSEFTGYVKDRSTTLPETTDRILATAVTARWRHGTLEVEVRMSMPNRHRFAVDLSPFGLTNDNEVFHADDRPTA
jgi:urate oxidase